ncbi:hypothetical protein CEUSTIGMA_g11755.t1 [Chlamydomonas eustigma]|uniref:CCHC-type domain-containing protein n=1 Tax=Chlamydomonas eustigma TaxID=1157962 RepID=A0A250XMT2_9CHLO|nr:hypothetical protein CEUSTIGMA_g11755.t1 [Chlamydomonas eustigma]|eukprot:GAX84333.1 hypothetical protein CEUSTIGMA_g11755.t1 [Chlamydomonas eustigma]
MSGCKVYVGGLRPDITEREVEDEFRRFGKLFKVWVARKPPGFAFIEFEDPRDAEDAVRKLDGQQGWRVEISRSRGPQPRGGGGPPPRGGRGDMNCFVCGEPGHMARDCRGGPPGGRGGDRYDRGGPDRGRGYSPRRSRSPPPRRSLSPVRGRSRSPMPRRSRSRS